MKATMSVNFNPEQTPISEIERKLKFIEKLPIEVNPKNAQFDLGKNEEFKKGFFIEFGKENCVDILPRGDVEIYYSDLDKLSKMKNCKIGSDSNCIYIHDNTVHNPDTYCFFYKGEKK
jgi:hypothetical protein